MKRRASKHERALLYRHQDGLCAICGCALGHDFHADHIKPFSVTGVTNVHDMQALCAPCNLRKGTMYWRKHQLEALELARHPGAGRTFTRVLASVTPGGGKSALPVIFTAELLKRRVIDKVCWVVPRDSLRKQAEEAFLSDDFRRLLNHDMEIRACKNDIDPSRDLSGYSTTYQSIALDPALHADEFLRRRYLLVLDEVHHVHDDSTTAAALRLMVERAAFVVFLSGTLSRADDKKIAFLPYAEAINGETRVITHSLTPSNAYPGFECIRYSRTDALRDEAVLPLYFERIDGRVEWTETSGERIALDSLSDAGDYTPKALFTALTQDYAKQLLKDAVDHWQEHRKIMNSRAKLLVVASSQIAARSYLNQLRQRGIVADIAVSDDGDQAKDAIDRLKGRKKPEVDALVTVAMAYEGMDCPSITHIACLTRIRSVEWIEQMLARATRIDRHAGPYEDQRAYVWAPDDQLFTACIDHIIAEQAKVLKDKEPKAGNGGNNGPMPAESIVPLSAEVTGARAHDPQTGDVVDAEEYQRARQVMRENGLAGLPVTLFVNAARQFEAAKASEPLRPRHSSAPQMTSSERVQAARRSLDRKIRALGKGDGDVIRDLNRAVLRMFGKPRDQMTETEILSAIERIDDAFPEARGA